MIPGLERLHPDPFHTTSKADLERAVAALDDAATSLDDDGLLVGLMRVVALVSAEGRDAHTGLYAWGEGEYPLTSLPLRLWVFDDGVHVVAALPPYEDLVGARIEAINGHPMTEVMATLDPLIPRDNDATVKLLLPRFMLIPEVLHGAGLADDPGSVSLTVAGDGTSTRTVDVEPVSMADYNAWAGPYGLHLPDDPRTRYLARASEPLWFEDAAPGVVYVGYNRVDGVQAAVLAGLKARLAEPDVDAVVIDIRHNYGGEVHAMEAMLRTLSAVPATAHRWLLTSRNTFSAASMFAARFTEDPDVTVVGEPMGGSPSLWGNARPVDLGDTGLVMDVSTLFEVGSDPDDPRLTIEPDIPVELTAADVAAGRDPVMATVLAADR